MPADDPQPVPAKKPPSSVTVAEAMISFLDERRPAPDADPRTWKTYVQYRSTVQALSGHFGRMVLTELTPSAVDGYRTLRRTAEGGGNAPEPGRRPTAGIPVVATVDGHLAVLRMIVNGYCRSRDIPFRLRLSKLASTRAKITQPLDPDDMARLLWAARGSLCVPDLYVPLEKGKRAGLPLKPRWYRPGTPASVRAKRRRRAHVVRLLLICFYTGTGLDCATSLRWGDPQGEESFVDTTEGLLHRRGRHAAPGNAAGLPIPIPERLLRHMRHWEAADREEGLDRVIHPFGRKEQRGNPWEAFDSIRSDAALDEGVLLKMVALTTGVVLAEQGFPTYPAALYVGMDPIDFAPRYEEDRPDYLENFVNALQRRPQAVRDRSEVAEDYARSQRRTASRRTDG